MGRYTLTETPGHPDQFNLAPKDIADPIPDDQKKIQQEVYEAANILKLLKSRGLFKNKDPEYNDYFNRIVQAAHTGCAANNVQTDSAAGALEQIRGDVVRREGRPVIYRYLAAYAGWSLIGLAIGAAIVLAAGRPEFTALTGYGWAIVSATVAAWFSAALLRSEVSFLGMQEYLNRTNEPIIRVLLVVVMTGFIALFLQVKLFAVEIGPVDLAKFAESVPTALVLGFVAGLFGEKILTVTLIDRVTKALPTGS